jgi:hypothetical protein
MESQISLLKNWSEIPGIPKSAEEELQSRAPISHHHICIVYKREVVASLPVVIVAIICLFLSKRTAWCSAIGTGHNVIRRVATRGAMVV